MEEGREVLAVPGNIFSKFSVGPNTLLRVGARPLLTPRDLFDALGCEPAAAALSDPDHGLLRFLGAGEALTTDEIAARAGIEISVALRDLLTLELAGEIVRDADGRFARVRPPGLVGEE
jgi:DNA processing protein